MWGEPVAQRLNKGRGLVPAPGTLGLCSLGNLNCCAGTGTIEYVSVDALVLVQQGADAAEEVVCCCCGASAVDGSHC